MLFRSTEKLTTVFYSISEKLYQQTAAANNAASGEAGTEGPHADENGDIHDAEYKVDEDNK